ncbi:transcriptional regulator TbsP [Haloferax namakaokahaiae]|uniref:Transcriptional regulator TbsP n=1 Tax=Haloferax namakaokahaiae TaxID=1748331 RepID=A0ABD5Z9R4_9EURY
MAIRSNLLAEGVEDIIRSVLDSTDEEVLITNPTAEVIEGLVDVATGFGGDLPTIRLVADEAVLKDVMDDFIIASNAADLVSEGTVSMRTAGEDVENTLFVTPNSVVALVAAGGKVAGLVTDDSDFVATAFDAHRVRWDDAPEFKLRTPPLSRVRETLSEDIGDDTRDDFDAVLSSLTSARGDGNGLDEVTISLLVAARNEVLLYDISKWGEDVGIASKATFSRTKTKLEDLGLIATEKVPIDVGRPRLRLKLGTDQLADADRDDLASVAQELLNG